MVRASRASDESDLPVSLESSCSFVICSPVRTTDCVIFRSVMLCIVNQSMMRRPVSHFPFHQSGETWGCSWMSEDVWRETTQPVHLQRDELGCFHVCGHYVPRLETRSCYVAVESAGDEASDESTCENQLPPFSSLRSWERLMLGEGVSVP